jgi:hypothetical protein
MWNVEHRIKRSFFKSGDFNRDEGDERDRSQFL